MALCSYYWCQIGAIFMSVNIAEIPTFVKDERLFTNVIYLFLISVILYSLRRQNSKSDCISTWSLFTLLSLTVYQCYLMT